MSFDLLLCASRRRLVYVLTLTLAGVLTGAGAAASAATESDHRVAWLYNKGSFKRTNDGAWLEVTAEKTQFHFREAARNPHYVELYDASRKMSVRLYGNTMYWHLPGQKNWNYFYHGRWSDPHKRPLDFEKGAREHGLIDSDGGRSFPHLGRQYEVLGPATKNYNCIAWSIGVTDRWVWPGGKVADFDTLYGQSGYRRIARLDYRKDKGVEKIVLYGKKRADGTWEATHGARQLTDGSWSSKLGALPLIRHLEPTDVDGPTYGVPIAVYTRRAR